MVSAALSALSIEVFAAEYNLYPEKASLRTSIHSSTFFMKCFLSITLTEDIEFYCASARYLACLIPSGSTQYPTEVDIVQNRRPESSQFSHYSAFRFLRR